MLYYPKSKFAMKIVYFFFIKVAKKMLLSILLKRGFDMKSILVDNKML